MGALAAIGDYAPANPRHGASINAPHPHLVSTESLTNPCYERKSRLLPSELLSGWTGFVSPPNVNGIIIG